MADRIDFSGQVAVVTGAGRGVGRAHARALAERGAAVVVNDLGTEIDGAGNDQNVAGAVVAEIEAAGGHAVASTDSVATPEGGQAVVQTALDAFGQVDLLVHNAGIVKAAPFPDISIDDVRDVLDVHLLGVWHVGQPAWRDMAARGYGRIVLTGSGAMYGHPTVGAYAAAKHGVIGIAKTMHQEAVMADLDIKVNVVAPIADTRMARDQQKARFGDLMDPANVSAVVTYLLSRDCALSGEVLHAGGSHVCRLFLGQTIGWASGRTGLTPEEVGEHLGEAFDLTGFAIPAGGNEATDLIHRRATGEEQALGDEIIPQALRDRS